MVSYDYTIAKTVTSDAEKERILAIFLNTHNGITDWEKATKDHGSASVASMKVSMNNMYKKIEKAGGKLPEDGNGSGSGGVGSQAPATPASKKRKSKAEIMVDGEDGEVVETPKAKRGRPRKNATPKIVKGEFKEGDDEVKADGDEGVKEERAAEDQV